MLAWNHQPGQDTRACRPVAPQSVKAFLYAFKAAGKADRTRTP
jgi:hypothetical protein